MGDSFDKWFGLMLMTLLVVMGAIVIVRQTRKPEAICAEQEKLTPFCEAFLKK